MKPKDDRPMRLYRVTLHDGPGQDYVSLHHGRTRSAAIYDAFLDMDSSNSFAEFLKWYKPSAVLAAQYPQPDGYDYIRRAYGVDPRVGQRCALRNEHDWTGKEGVVLYPGTSTAHVHVLVDGQKHHSIVHPANVVMLDQAAQVAA